MFVPEPHVPSVPLRGIKKTTKSDPRSRALHILSLLLAWRLKVYGLVIIYAHVVIINIKRSVSHVHMPVWGAYVRVGPC